MVGAGLPTGELPTAVTTIQRGGVTREALAGTHCVAPTRGPQCLGCRKQHRVPAHFGEQPTSLGIQSSCRPATYTGSWGEGKVDLSSSWEGAQELASSQQEAHRLLQAEQIRF